MSLSWQQPTVSSITERLTAIGSKPQMFIGTIDADSMFTFLWAYRSGIHTALPPGSQEYHERIIAEVAAERGYTNRLPFHEDLRSHHLSESEIIKTMIEVEIESWRRMERAITKDGGCNSEKTV
jgi:hypothetical protein